MKRKIKYLAVAFFIFYSSSSFAKVLMGVDYRTPSSTSEEQQSIQPTQVGGKSINTLPTYASFSVEENASGDPGFTQYLQWRFHYLKKVHKPQETMVDLYGVFLIMAFLILAFTLGYRIVIVKGKSDLEKGWTIFSVSEGKFRIELNVVLFVALWVILCLFHSYLKMIHFLFLQF